MNPRSIPWLRVFVEGVVIVGSILLAFGIQAWWDARGESRARDALRDALLNDMVQATDEAERVRLGHEQGRDAAAALLDLRARAPLSSQDADLVDSLLWAVIYSPSYDAPLGAVAALLGSGNIDVLADADLTLELTAFPALVADLEREQGLLTQFVNQLLGYLWEQGVDTSDMNSPSDSSSATQGSVAYTLVGEAEFRGLTGALATMYQSSSIDLALVGQAVQRIRTQLATPEGE